MKITEILFGAILMAVSVESTVDRLGLFRQHHVNHSKKQLNSGIATRWIVREKLCTAKTCSKCNTMMMHNTSGLTKVKAGCRKLLGIRNCCTGASKLYFMF